MLALLLAVMIALCFPAWAQMPDFSVPTLSVCAADEQPGQADAQDGAADQAGIPAERPVDRSKTGRDRAPIIHLPVVDTPPVLDGDLSDPCWRRSYHSDGFWNCDQDREPDQRSEIWLCVDAGHLYVASYFHDTEPEKIHYEQKKRNGNIWTDDFIKIHIDPTYTQGGNYRFHVTPRGTMKEDIPGGSDAKIEWRGDWRAAGTVVPDGWTAEVAIPWGVLRYPKGQSEIGVAIARHIPRTDEWTAWPDMGAGWDNKEWARIVGLRLPHIKRPVIFMPNVQTEWTEDHFRNNVGLDVKHTFENGLTAVATWQPDFRNIEDEVESIDFSYTERYYRDRRPFFTTGSGFIPGGDVFYSRRIEDLDLGFKVFGRVKDTDIGLLHALTFGERNDLATEVRHKIDDNLSCMGQYVRRDVRGDPLNQVFGTRLERYEPKGCGGLWMSTNFSESDTRGGAHGNKWGLHLDRWRGEGHWGYWAGYEAVGAHYDPQDGFAPEVDRRGPYVGFSLWEKPQDSWIKSYGGHISWDRSEHFDGTLFKENYGFGANLVRKQQKDGLSLWMGWTDRPPNYDHTIRLQYWWGEGELHKGGHLSCAWGDRASGDYVRYTAGYQWEFVEDFYGNLYYERRKSDYWDLATEDEDIDRLTLKLNYDLDEEHGLGFCMRTGTAGTNAFLTYRQAVREGEDMFIILGDPNADHTQARIAFQTKWIWR